MLIAVVLATIQLELTYELNELLRVNIKSLLMAMVSIKVQYMSPLMGAITTAKWRAGARLLLQHLSKPLMYSALMKQDH